MAQFQGNDDNKLDIGDDCSEIFNDMINPRFQSCSFYPYSLNEDSKVVILMRQKCQSNYPDMYRDFGTNYNADKDYDPCILHTAAMSYIQKCAGLCLANEINNLDD